MSDAPVSSANDEAGEAAFARAIASAQADIAKGVEKAGLRDDPLRYPLAAISTTLGLFPDLIKHMREAAQEAQRPLDAAAVERMEKAAAQGASRASAELVRAHNRRSVLIGSLSVAASVILALAGGYWWGRSAAITSFRISEANFAAMMHDSPQAAIGWLHLAQLNDYSEVMASCRGDNAIKETSGRKACMLPVWLDPPPAGTAPKGSP